MSKKHGTALSLGQFTELAAAVLKALPRDIDPTVADGWVQNGASLVNALKTALCPPINTKAEPSVTGFDPAFVGENWSVESGGEPLAGWNSKSATAISALLPLESSITGDEWRRRLASKTHLGASEFLHYWNNQGDIPAEWKGKYVFFDRTVLRGPYGGRYSLSLYWHGGRWYWSYYWLDYDRDADYLSALAS